MNFLKDSFIYFISNYSIDNILTFYKNIPNMISLHEIGNEIIFYFRLVFFIFFLFFIFFIFFILIYTFFVFLICFTKKVILNIFSDNRDILNKLLKKWFYYVDDNHFNFKWHNNIYFIVNLLINFFVIWYLIKTYLFLGFFCLLYYFLMFEWDNFFKVFKNYIFLLFIFFIIKFLGFFFFNVFIIHSFIKTYIEQNKHNWFIYLQLKKKWRFIYFLNVCFIFSMNSLHNWNFKMCDLFLIVKDHKFYDQMNSTFDWITIKTNKYLKFCFYILFLFFFIIYLYLMSKYVLKWYEMYTSDLILEIIGWLKKHVFKKSVLKYINYISYILYFVLIFFFFYLLFINYKLIIKTYLSKQLQIFLNFYIKLRKDTEYKLLILWFTIKAICEIIFIKILRIIHSIFIKKGKGKGKSKYKRKCKRKYRRKCKRKCKRKYKRKCKRKCKSKCKRNVNLK